MLKIKNDRCMKLCNRCGNLYNTVEFDQKRKTIKARPVMKITLRTFGIEKDIDLCESCSTKFKEFLGNDREDSTESTNIYKNDYIIEHDLKTNQDIMKFRNNQLGGRHA